MEVHLKLRAQFLPERKCVNMVRSVILKRFKLPTRLVMNKTKFLLFKYCPELEQLCTMHLEYFQV